MLPPFLTNTYHSYKQDTNNIATWLAVTAKKLGCTEDFLTASAQSNAPKSQRLKGKARTKAKQTQRSSASNASSTSTNNVPKYTIRIRDFVTLAEYLAPNPKAKVPVGIRVSLDRAIRLRRMHNDYHTLKHAGNMSSDGAEGHSYFLEVLEQVRDILTPRSKEDQNRFQESSTAAQADVGNDAEGRLDNMFAVLTVDEPSEEFLSIPDKAPIVEEAQPADAIYEPEPSDDPLELYLGVAALLQDCSKIRNALDRIWRAYSQGATSLISAAASTNVAIQMVQNLETRFLKDQPSASDSASARKTFFAAQCLLEGNDPTDRVRPSDPVNLRPYGLAETSLFSSHILVKAFADVLEDQTLPLYKAGYFGVFNPTKDRQKMSGPEKFDEDKVLLLEILSDIVIFQYANKSVALAAVDEFSKALGLLRVEGRHTLALDFAAQVYLDIQQVLRGKTGMAWRDLGVYALNAKETLKQNLQFHEKLRIDNWPRENDQVLKSILTRVENWFEKDSFQQFKAEKLLQSGGNPEPYSPHSFFIGHPWLCGSLLFGLKLDMQATGVSFLNAWGSAKFTAQIYNAARQEKFLAKEWEDMEIALLLYGEAAMFVGGRPKTVEECFRHFCLAMGYSAQHFARGGARSHSRPIESAQGPRGVIEETHISPVAHELRFGYLSFESPGKETPDIEKVVQKCLEDNEDFGDSDAAKAVAGSNKRNVQTTPEALTLICESLMSEELALTFDHFRLHRSSWRVLRAMKDACDSDLRRIYSPSYIDAESQLPFLVGYIFMTAVQTKKIGRVLLPKKEDVVSSKLLMKAGNTLEVMIESDMGDLEVRILRDKYGIEFEVQRD